MLRLTTAILLLTLNQTALASDFDTVGIKLGSNSALIEEQLLDHSNRKKVQRAESKVSDDPTGWIEESAHLSHMVVSGMKDKAGARREEMIRVMFHRKPADETSAAVVRRLVPRGNEPTLDSITASITKKYGQPANMRDEKRGRMSEIRYVFGDSREACTNLMMDSFQDRNMSVKGFDSRSIKRYARSKLPKTDRDAVSTTIDVIKDCSESLLIIINYRDNPGKSVWQIRSALVDIKKLIDSNDQHDVYWEDWRDEFLKKRAENASEVKF